MGLVSSPSEKMFDEDGDRAGAYGDLGSTISLQKSLRLARRLLLTCWA
jgi:hypothetical protein